MKKMSLKAKLLTLFLLVGVTPFATASILALWNSSTALEEQAYNKLVMARDVKKNQIERFFEERRGDMGVLMETVATLEAEAEGKLQAVQQIKKSQLEGFFAERYGDVSVLAGNDSVQAAVVAFEQAFDAEGGKAGGEKWQAVEKQFGQWLKQYQQEYGYYDLFLISADGDVVYSVCKESDLGQNLQTGKLKSSSLGRCFQAATVEPAIGDFEPYEPSNGAQAAFIGAPVKQDGKLVGVVALQIPTGPINKIVQKRDGMGTTGETYVVGKGPGGKIAFRSDMQTMGDGKYVIGYPISTPYIQKALEGESAIETFTDSSGSLVMVAYDPLEIDGLHWASVSKINLEEVIAPKLEGEEDDYYTKYIEKYGYYDLFLIHPQGKAFYTVCREADFNTNLVDGKYAGSNLGKLVREVIDSRSFGLADFEPYAPSNGAPAAFIAEPIVKHGKVQVVVALQLSLEAINNIMRERAGMGETGETYLVGPDKRMRSDSFLDPEGHSVAASFAGTVQSNGVDTEAAREALAGNTDAKIVTDYNGNPVLSAYTPVKVGDTTWALLAEVDESEAFAAVTAMKWLMGIIAVVGVAAIVGVALLVAASIAGPINRIITGLSAGAEQTTEAAGQVSSASQSLAQGASEGAAAVEETTASMEEMSSMTKQNASNASQADDLMTRTSKAVSNGQESMKQLDQAIGAIKTSSDETAKVLKTIDDIAFQTNLLALNAAVEAARAGEAGKGFAVVAEEVRNLAMRSAEAARNTAGMIEESVKNADNGVNVAKQTSEAFAEITTNAEKVGQLVSEIASASNEQSQGIDQISTAITQMDQVTQGNAANAEESASASEELSAQAEELNNMVQQLRLIVGGSSAQGEQQDFRASQKRRESPSSQRKAGPVTGGESQTHDTSKEEAISEF